MRERSIQRLVRVIDYACAKAVEDSTFYSELGFWELLARGCLAGQEYANGFWSLDQYEAARDRLKHKWAKRTEYTAKWEAEQCVIGRLKE